MQTTIEFQSNQKELWGVICFHNFFQDNICREFEYIPSHETSVLMRNLYLTLKPLDFGFVILQNNEKSSELLQTLHPKTKLTFYVKVTNYRFVNFTELPFTALDEVFYYSNLTDESAELPEVNNSEVFYYFRNLKVGELEKKLLHLSQHSAVKIKPKKFFLNFGSDKGFKDVESGSFADLKITDHWGEDQVKQNAPYKIPAAAIFSSEIRLREDMELRKLIREGLDKEEAMGRMPKIREEIAKSLENLDQPGVPVDLRHVPSGKYSVAIGKKSSQDFYVTNEEIEQTFGVIDLYLSGPGSPPENCLIREALTEGEDNGLCHVINFEARTTYWRYLFLNYKGSSIEALEVRDEEGKVDFSKPRADVLDFVGKPTLIVESQSPIQLKQIPKQEFWLKRTKGKRTIKDIKLPTANAETIKPIRQKGDSFKVVSDIYVYL